MITTFLSDGLGNQMFQYAFARALQLHTKNELSFVLTAFENDQSGRKYSLTNFCINEHIEIVPKLKGCLLLNKFKLLDKIRVIRSKQHNTRYTGKNFISGCVSDVYGFQDYKHVNFDRDILVRGHFQSPLYFQEHSDTIKRELKVKALPTPENKRYIEKIESTESVCVHMRRGDYLDSQWKHLNVCDYKYYINAMKLLAEKVENPKFYIFSNSHEDIEWIKENYDFSGYSIEYVDLNNPDYEEIRLMYSCKHFIISNSTFSWWAQYLGENENKVVVAPSVWNKGNVDFSGIYMPEWHLVDIDN